MALACYIELSDLFACLCLSYLRTCPYTCPISVGQFMMLEVCDVGVMRTWLQSQKSKMTDANIDTLYRITFDIAKGMDYLASKQVNIQA